MSARLPAARVRVARLLLLAAKVVAPVALHADARHRETGERTALVAVGPSATAVGGLALEVAQRYAGSILGPLTLADDLDDDGDDW